MVRPQRKKPKPDPLKEYASYYLAIRRWQASYSGPTWKRTDIPHTDWRGGPDWIEHEYAVEYDESLSLHLVVEPYRQEMKVSKRDIHSFEFEVMSGSEPHGGLFQICPDRELRGWVTFPVAGVQALLTLLTAGQSVVLDVNGSKFKRGTALIRTNSAWWTEGHPRLEAEFE